MSPASARHATRRYRGSPADERRAQRREQLIRAAIRVYGERGYRQATVKAVCEAAGLTERYFYESFANSEALLISSYRAVTCVLLRELELAGGQGGGAATGAERVRAVLARYFEALRGDPPSARVFLVEIAGASPGLDRVFAASVEDFGLLVERMLGRATPADSALRTAVIGGVIHLARDWVAGGDAAREDAVVAAALRLCLLLGGPAAVLDKHGSSGGL